MHQFKSKDVAMLLPPLSSVVDGDIAVSEVDGGDADADGSVGVSTLLLIGDGADVVANGGAVVAAASNDVVGGFTTVVLGTCTATGGNGAHAGSSAPKGQKWRVPIACHWASAMVRLTKNSCETDPSK